MSRLGFTALAAGVALALGACSGGGSSASPTVTGGTTAASGPAAGPALALDAGFGKDGVARVALAASGHQRFMAVTTAPDGKTYAAGFVTLSGGDQAMAVARVDAKGGLDRSFGKDGIASVNVAIGGKAGELARSIVVQSTGKIVVAGPVEHDPAAAGDAAKDTDVAVVRFEADGKIDTSFGKAGVAIIDLGAGKTVSGAWIGDNPWGLGTLGGDRLAVWSTTLSSGAGRTDPDYVLTGLTSAGALDTGFGTGGKVVVDLGSSIDNPRNVLVQGDGKIVATGYSNIGGVVQPVLVRTSASGVLDKEFGKDGVATAKLLDGVTESYSVSAQGADYILAGYGRGADANEKVDLVVYRFKGNGTLDTAFGTKGLFRLDIAKDDDRARNVMVLPDQRILAVGSGKKTAANVDAMAVLLSKDGQPDVRFGSGGALITDLGGPADAWYGMTLTPDRKAVILAGYKGTDATSGGTDEAVLARFQIS